MYKTLYAYLLIILCAVGVGSLFYGLYILWEPLAYIVGGLFLIGLAGLLNQAYDNLPVKDKKGGEK